jgi:hypothetical protein
LFYSLRSPPLRSAFSSKDNPHGEVFIATRGMEGQERIAVARGYVKSALVSEGASRVRLSGVRRSIPLFLYKGTLPDNDQNGIPDGVECRSNCPGTPDGGPGDGGMPSPDGHDAASASQ